MPDAGGCAIDAGLGERFDHALHREIKDRDIPGDVLLKGGQDVIGRLLGLTPGVAPRIELHEGAEGQHPERQSDPYGRQSSDRPRLIRRLCLVLAVSG